MINIIMCDHDLVRDANEIIWNHIKKESLRRSRCRKRRKRNINIRKNKKLTKKEEIENYDDEKE